MSTTTSFQSIAEEIIRQYRGQNRLAVETTAASGGSTTNPLILNKGYSGYSANAFDGCNVYVVGITAPAEASVTRGGAAVSGANLSLTTSPAMGANPNSSKAIWIMGPLTRGGILSAVNQIVTNLYAPAWLPYPNLVTDGDMETSGVGNWTDVLTPTTKEKVTTASRVFLGKQALHVITDAADEGVTSDSVNVFPNETLIVSAAVMVDAGDVSVQLYDVTNSVVLQESSGIDFEGYSIAYFTWTVSGSTEQVAVRVLSDTVAASEFYVGYAQLLSQMRLVYTLPSTFDNVRHIKDIFYWPQLQSTDINYSYIPQTSVREHFAYDPDGLRDYQGANSHKIQLLDRPLYPLFCDLRREDAALSADSDTTTLPKEVVVNGAMALIYRDLADMHRPHSARQAQSYDQMSAARNDAYQTMAIREGLIKREPEIAWRYPRRVRG